jgi:hypothetical protein
MGMGTFASFTKISKNNQFYNNTISIHFYDFKLKDLIFSLNLP